MEQLDLNQFEKEVTCTYKNETYGVRDNGAVFRHPRVGNRLRKYDYQWTFGKPNDKTGYMTIASVRVHRIVATAFHGLPPTKEHVVDHIDTNRRNNRPDNLRWVTRLENALLNPITAKRIAIICGSIEAFLADPAKYRDLFPEPNYKWMCTVGKKEARNSLERLNVWAKSDKLPSGGSLGDWIFERSNLQSRYSTAEVFPEIVNAITPNAIQRIWRIPSEFPCCPQELNGKPLVAYFENLQLGSVFCRNDVYSSMVLKFAISDDQQSLYVISESSEENDAVKPWTLAKITYENGLLVHTSLGSFFSKEGADKQFCLVQGLEWTGGDSIDDYL